jgi:hypothetical protein
VTTDGGVCSLLKDHIQGDWQRIELGAVGLGVPDLNFCIDGVEGWLEAKTTDTHRVVFRPFQAAWAARRSRAGGRVLVVTRRRHSGGPRKGGAVDELWVHPGVHAALVEAGGLLGAPVLGVWAGGPRRWDWEAVRRAICGPLPAI